MEKEELIAAARDVAARRGVRSLRLADFRAEVGVGSEPIYTHFDSWYDLCEAAGLEPDFNNRRVPNEELFGALRACCMQHGGLCTFREFKIESRYAYRLIRRRFSNWRGMLSAFRGWVLETTPEFPYLAALDAKIASLADAGAARGAAPPGPTPLAGPPWPARGGRTCGDPIAFRALLFAPVNEHGVILLFGMVAEELGYRVETVAPGFPDCTARRRVAGGRWESVRVEFEYRSRSFREHGHDAAGCDVIVCWEHDWADCPLEVLALRPAIGALPARG